MEQETCAVRPAEALDLEALGAFLRRELGSAQPRRERSNGASAPLNLEQFPGGHSNLTYLARLGDLEVVIRRAPLGPLPPRAHDMVREYRWLQAVHPHFPLAPQPLFLCEDPSIIGSAFYGMERRRGFVVRPHEPAALDGNHDRRRKVSLALVDTLAALHAIGIAGAQLTALGKPSGFVARQVAGWSDRWEHARTSSMPEMDALSRWLTSHLPAEPLQPAIVHGDFKLDNVMLDTLDPSRIVAVLDWEMSALGDPLVDLGILLAYWPPTFPPHQPGWHTTTGDRRGWLTRDEIVDRYAALSGRDLGAMSFYETFALFKVAVVIQQIFVRYQRGQTSDPRFAELGNRVEAIARQAAARAAS